MKKVERKKLGDLLYETGMISKEQLDWVIKEQKRTGKRIGEVITESGLLTEKDLMGALEFQLGIPHMDLEKYTIDYTIASKVPESIARRYVVVAVGYEGDKLKVAMKDPLDMFALDDLKISTKMEIVPILAAEKEINDLLNQIYASNKTKNIVFELEKQIQEDVNKQVEEETEENAPMVQLVNNILQRSILKEASDIHIEPFESYVRVRYRIDGQLQELTRTKKETLNGITARIKILSGLDIAERRLPQDGRMSRVVEGQQVDCRVSILPTIYGEKTVIRLMYRTGRTFSLTELGLHPQDLEKVKNMLKNPHGIILATGPTGSGKSTTLVAALKELNKNNVNIITVEDPVENMIEGINQVSINSKIGLTFANSLRAILRQDPDIIMVGEMRDSETSSIAIRAAITGHLVLSTLHTNDAPSSIARLIDMGTEPFMVGAALKGVISQRLVRKVCPNCKQKYTVTSADELIYKVPKGTVVYAPRGCSMCHYTGYKGRIAIHEIMLVDSILEGFIAANHLSNEELKIECIKRGMRTLWDNAYYNVLEGHTTLQEMLRIAYEQ
ncbi:type II secretion system protein GspE [Sporanaerobium hydrogeniformans]|uniref:Type II secretion system protein GspE n=1 Tax=Sporanaerobium hydrogeniformans TaxID=3072179 RepID=A0AC61DLE7_9FIRM|nr:GspE/PulE family protein [Sporanaerobium hydrogeniformans]PHV72332.1 type II secretion system protein GspE [Sporanaerobium hydrogeniformans]